MADQRTGAQRSTGRRGTYHHGDLKRALTQAALALVAEKGPKGFTLTEAARRAGVSSAAPYRHFADKAQLLAAVATEGFIQLHEALRAAGDLARWLLSAHQHQRQQQERAERQQQHG